MKLLILVALSCLSLSCSKSTADNSGITGTWQLWAAVGGIAGTIQYPANNGILLNFGANGHYVFSSPGQAPQTGTYQLKKSAHAGDWILYAYYAVNGQQMVQRDSINLDIDILSMLPAESCCDIATNVYKRLPQ